MITTYSFIGSTTGTALQTLGADAVFKNQTLTLTSVMPIAAAGVQSASGIVPTSAETAGQITITPTNAASSYFAIEVTQWVPSLNQWVKFILDHSTAASGSSATTICNAWKSQFDSYADSGYELTRSSTGTGTLVLDTVAGSPIFSVVSLNSAVTVGIVINTAGISAVNTYTALTQAGFTGQLSGRTYASVTFTFTKANNSDTAGVLDSGLYKHTLFIDTGDANYAALIVSLQTALSAMGLNSVGAGTQSLSGAGAVNITQYATLVTTTGVDALTLADGVEGQEKLIVMIVDGGDGTLTPTNLLGWSTITLNTVGDAVLLRFLSGKWNVVSNFGCTIA